MSQHIILGFEKIDPWLQNADPERRRRLLVWLAAVASGPDEVTSYAWQRAGRGHKLRASTIPGADLVVVFTVAVAPVRAVIILDLFDVGQLTLWGDGSSQ